MISIHSTKSRALWLSIGLILVLALPGIAQKGFNMEEKEMIRNYKFSNTHYLKGEKLFKKGKIEKAVQALEKCIEIFPRHDKANFILADIYLKKKQLDKAETHIRAAKEGFKYLQKWYAFTYQEYMDKLRTRQSEIDKQLVGLQQAKSDKSRPGQKSFYDNKILLLKTEKEAIESRLTDFTRTGVQMPAGYNYVHGNIFFLSRRFRDAVNEYNKTLEKDPKHGGACNNLASIYFMHKQVAKAREYLDRAVACGAKINPRFQAALKKAEGK